MRILFVLVSPEFLRFYDSTIRLLAERGHWVGVAVNEQNDAKPVRLEHLQGGGDIEPLDVIPARRDWWTRLTPVVRGAMDYVRYLGPQYAHAPALRARAAKKGLRPALRFIDARAKTREQTRVARIVRRLAAMERAIPPSADVTQFLRQHNPDVVVVSPLVDTASEQVDVVRSAQALGIRTVAAIASWDNLTNKGLLRVVPDAVMVWNEAQKREAVELHGIPAERVVVTGGPLFDKWFDRQPSRSLDVFAKDVGLAASHPFILFTGSSMFISAPEAEVAFVKRWLTVLRASNDPEIRDAPVLIRPHPYNGWIWADVDVSDFPNVAVWPRGRYNPVDETNRNDYFDSLYYARAVVGVNTTAMIEAAIVGRPVHSIVADDFARTQEGTLHFHYLLPDNGGFLRVASTLDQHVALLGETLRETQSVRDQMDAFVRWFVRPHGIDRPSTPILVEALERVATGPLPAPVTTTVGDLAIRALIAPLPPLVPLLDGWSRIERRLAPLLKLPRMLRWTRKYSIRTAHLGVRLGRKALHKTVWSMRAAGGWVFRRGLRLMRQARYEAGIVARRGRL